MSARTSFYRPTGASRRTNARQIHDHDVFEGLPIRRWSKQWIWIANTPENVPANANMTNTTSTAADLPLPKDTHLLTPMSQTLLQAARNGTLSKPIEDDSSKDEGEQNAESHRLFLTNKWTVAPRDNEPPDVEYLSKITRGVKRKVNGKFVDIEEEVPLGGTIGGAIPLDPIAVAKMQRRPPPPRKKGLKGRKPGFRKMVTFAEDGKALPSSQEGIAMPPPEALESSMNMIVEEGIITSDTTINTEQDNSTTPSAQALSTFSPKPIASTADNTDADVEMSDAGAMPSSSIAASDSILLPSPTTLEPARNDSQNMQSPPLSLYPAPIESSTDPDPSPPKSTREPSPPFEPLLSPSPMPLKQHSPSPGKRKATSPIPSDERTPQSHNLPPRPPSPRLAMSVAHIGELVPSSSLPQKPAFLSAPSKPSPEPSGKGEIDG